MGFYDFEAKNLNGQNISMDYPLEKRHFTIPEKIADSFQDESNPKEEVVAFKQTLDKLFGILAEKVKFITSRN